MPDLVKSQRNVKREGMDGGRCDMEGEADFLKEDFGI
jgi:hypothetical protein